MRKVAKLLPLAFALVVALSCASVPAFAATEDNVAHYDSMLVLGDSVARGCGLDPGYNDTDNPIYLNGVEGSFPDLVADACDIPTENRYFCAYPGTSLSSALVLLGEEQEENDALLTGTYYAEHFYAPMKKYFGEDGIYQIAGETGTLAQSDLIILELGMGDVLYRAKTLSHLQEAVSGTDLLGNPAPGTYDTTESAMQFVVELYNGYNYVVENYHKLLDYIKEYNPDAQVVIVGFYTRARASL